jgi:hypothetical protein
MVGVGVVNYLRFPYLEKRISPSPNPFLSMETSPSFRAGCFKSPFFKGGFRGINQRFFDPSFPSLAKREKT